MSRAIAKVNDLSWMTGGPQGSGVDSSANIFAGACVLGGLWTFGLREYYSSIKGPHSYFEVRVNSDKIRSHVNNVDVLATFDAETLIRHAEEVDPGGGILYDPTFSNIEIDKVDTIETPVVLRIKARLSKQGLPGNVTGILEEAKRRGVNLFPIPYNDIIAKTASQIGSTSSASSQESSTSSQSQPPSRYSVLTRPTSTSPLREPSPARRKSLT